MKKKKLFRFIAALLITVLGLSGFTLTLLLVLLDTQRYSLAKDQSVTFTPDNRYEWILTIESPRNLTNSQAQSIYQQLEYEPKPNSIPFQLIDFTGNYEHHSSSGSSSVFTKSIAKFLPTQTSGQISVTIQPDTTFPNAHFAVQTIRPLSGIRVFIAIGLWIIGASGMLYCTIMVFRSDWKHLKDLFSTKMELK